MKQKFLLLPLFVGLSFLQMLAAAPSLLQFKISRTYCVLNFLETCKGANGTSEALRNYIDASTANDPAFKQLIGEYVALDLNTLYTRQGFPQSRPSYRSTLDLIIIAAIQTDNLEDFKKRIVGILHNTDYSQLLSIMQRADVYYEKIIWSPHGKAAKRQLKELQKYQKSANAAFVKLKHFYNSSWPDDMPFTIALTPVPGKSGGMAATPHANSLCVDVFTEETNYPGRVAITMHEICHVLFAEQSREMQAAMESYFQQSKSPFAPTAYNYMDEGLATASGNGWVFQNLTGHIDPTGWYSDPYIDGFGHALFPLVSQYLADNKSIDKDFVDAAIRLWAEKFPRSPEELGIQFNHLTLYADEERPVERNQIRQDLLNQFMVSWLNFSTPILGTEGTSFLQESGGTQLVIIDRDYEKTLSVLKKTLPELNAISYNLSNDFVINFIDAKKRLVLIAKIQPGGTSSLFQTLKKKQFVNTDEPYWKL